MASHKVQKKSKTDVWRAVDGIQSLFGFALLKCSGAQSLRLWHGGEFLKDSRRDGLTCGKEGTTLGEVANGEEFNLGSGQCEIAVRVKNVWWVGLLGYFLCKAKVKVVK